MPNRQSLQLDAANEQLEQIKGVIRAAQQQLGLIQDSIRNAEREHRFKVSSLKRIYKKKVRDFEANYTDSIEKIQHNLLLLRVDIKERSAEKGLIEYEIGELGRKLQFQRQEYDAARRDDADKLVRLKDSVERATEILGAKEAELTSLNDRLHKATKQVDHFEKLLVQAEESYTERVAELRSNLSAAESKLQQTERLIQEYESSMAVTREVDEARRIDLEGRENLLAAAKRALGQNHADFDAEKKRFYQTKSL